MKQILALLLCAAAALCSLSAQQSLRRAPSWALYDSQGKLRDILDYRGKVLIIDMMQTTCPHCNSFADVLQKVQQRYGDKVAIVGVVTVLGPQADTPDKVAAYIAGHHVTYPIVFDMAQMQVTYVQKTQISFPQLYVIDQNGYIRGDWTYGVTTRDIFEGNGLFNELDRLTGKK